MKLTGAMWLSYAFALGYALSDDGDASLHWHPAIEAAVALHGEHQAEVGGGLRLRYARAHDSAFDQPTTSSIIDWSADLDTFDIALDLDLTRAPIAFHPWVGVHLARGTERTLYTEMDPARSAPPATTSSVFATPQLAFGALLSLDLVSVGDVPLGVFVAGELATRSHDKTLPPHLGEGYGAFTTGVSIRYQ